jgi:hypothetical protein
LGVNYKNRRRDGRRENSVIAGRERGSAHVAIYFSDAAYKS